VRGHHHEIAAGALRVLDDRFPRVQGLDGVGFAAHARGLAGFADLLHAGAGDALLRIEELLRRRGLHFGDGAVREGLLHADREDLCAHRLGQPDGGVDSLLCDVGAVGRNEDALEHGGPPSL
jgi:hypothetical protein